MKKLITGLVTSIIVFAPIAVSASTMSVSHSLSVGSKGEEVMTLQQLLVKLGVLKSAPSGYFGNLTRLAVMSFQKTNGLAAVGTVGPKTRILINAALTQLSAPAPSGATTTNANMMSPPPAANLGTSSATVVPPPPPPAPPVSTSTAPVVSLITPMGPVSKATTDFEFAVASDKPASCRYGTQPGMTLSNMTSFIDTNNTMRHSRILTGLSSGGLYIYYVRCEDSVGRSSNELQVTISLTGN